MLIRKFIAFILLLFCLPFLLILMILVRLETKGNPLFIQTRVGRGGKEFRIYKLRTMTVSTVPNVVMSSHDLMLANVYRITSFGKFLRRFHLDEIPQLLNIVKGEMVFIGPRPLLPIVINNRYYAPRDNNEFPGFTSLWQISSFCYREGYISEKLDKFYIRKKCLILETLILFWTVKLLFKLIIKQ